MKRFTSGLMKYNRYFEGYNDNIPVIYSTLEGQYPGEIYLDDEEQIAVLVTKFDFLFLGGNIKNGNAESIINEIIFYELVKKQQRKEIILFGQDEQWNTVISKIFQNHHGVRDLRKCYRLNRHRFIECCNDRIPDTIKMIVRNERENDSAVEYPVSRVYLDEVNISFCSAFMLAKGYAEIDIATEEAYRQKGYGKIAAIALIKELLLRGIEPNWCTWPYRLESQALAESIGFELEKEISAHIWVDEFGF